MDDGSFILLRLLDDVALNQCQWPLHSRKGKETDSMRSKIMQHKVFMFEFFAVDIQNRGDKETNN